MHVPAPCSAWGWFITGCLMLPLLAMARGAEPQRKTLRAGIIGLDTSHVIAFTSLLNQENPPDELAGVRVVAAYPGGSPDVESSRSRVEGYTQEIQGFGVEIVDSIEALLPKVDCVLLESVDGRPHRKQAEPVIRAGKPLFIDKPVAGSLSDAIAIFEFAKEHRVPCFSSSSLRYSPGVASLRADERVGDMRGCFVYSPCHLEPHHPDLFWYGVHGVEMLFTIMGTGCATVARTHTDDADVVTGVWSDGRVGTYRGLRNGASDYGAIVFGSKGIVPGGKYAGYEPLVAEIVKFFHTGQVPVSAEETLEIFAFMEAADESKRQGGMPVSLAKVMEAAKAAAGK
jgi:predicted dehydrogenase